MYLLNFQLLSLENHISFDIDNVYTFFVMGANMIEIKYYWKKMHQVSCSQMYQNKSQFTMAVNFTHS